MRFVIETKIGPDRTSFDRVDDFAAADAIEDWSSRFTDKARTKYGMKLTLEYVRGLIVNEVGKFVQPITGPKREEFLIRRVA